MAENLRNGEPEVGANQATIISLTHWHACIFFYVRHGGRQNNLSNPTFLVKRISLLSGPAIPVNRLGVVLRNTFAFAVR